MLGGTIASLQIQKPSVAANVAGGLVQGAKLTSTALNTTSKLVQEEVSREMIHWIVEAGAHTSTELVGMINEASKPPKTGARFYLRHITGVISPTYVGGAVAVLFFHQDPDLWKYGPSAIAQKRMAEIIRRGGREISHLQTEIDAMSAQLGSSIYMHKLSGVPQTPPSHARH